MRFDYKIKAHPTMYKGVEFRSRLEARWAAFFDLVGWSWEYEPIDFVDWTPDFKVSFSCGHSECPEKHYLLAEVKPFDSIQQFKGLPVERNRWGSEYGTDGGLMLGLNPDVSEWEMAHGSGGGICTLDEWIFRRGYGPKPSDYVHHAWKEAGNLVQWRPSR